MTAGAESPGNGGPSGGSPRWAIASTADVRADRPTGIDIRDGLQMECVHCTQCIDACDAVMEKIGKPRGLIRYSSQESLAGAPRRLLRPRTVIYPMALAAFLGTFIFQLETKAAADVTLLRTVGAPFALDADGNVVNQVRLKIANRSGSDRAYRITVTGADRGTVVVPQNPFPVGRGRTETTSLFVTLPAAAFAEGEPSIGIQIADGSGFDQPFTWRLLGPSGHDGQRARGVRDDSTDGRRPEGRRE